MAFTRLLRNLCPRPELRPARRADHPRRGPHLRHGLAVPGARHLRLAGPEVRAGRPRPAALLHRVHRRPDPRGGHHRGRRPGVVDRGRHVATPPAACRWCRSSSSIRCSGSSGSATSSGPRPTPGPAGFLLGATAGRTTLLGEGLQHQDGHSLVLASTVPDVPGLRPGLRLRDGRHRRRRHPPHVPRRRRHPARTSSTTSPSTTRTTRCPALPEGVARGASSAASTGAPTPPDEPRAASHDPVLRHRPPGRGRRARAELAEHYGVGAELWSATSLQALREDALAVERWNRLHPDRARAHAAGHPAAGRARRARSSPSPTS